MSFASYTVDAVPVRRTDFLRSERLVTVLGACALGAAIGFGVAVALGRTDTWSLFFMATIVLAVALYPASANMADAGWSDSLGCRFAAVVHLVSLLAWPLAIHFAGAFYWAAPAVAVSSLVLMASCWTGSARLVYRLGLQGVLISGLAAYEATMALMGT